MDFFWMLLIVSCLAVFIIFLGMVTAWLTWRPARKAVCDKLYVTIPAGAQFKSSDGRVFTTTAVGHIECGEDVSDPIPADSDKDSDAKLLLRIERG